MAQEMVPKVALMTPVEYVRGLSWRPPQSGNAFLDRYILVCVDVYFVTLQTLSQLHGKRHGDPHIQTRGQECSL